MKAENAPSRSPWGVVDHSQQIAEGVYWVGTPSHGGLMVRQRIASELLTPSAQKEAEPYGLWLCFEEDCAYAVALFERPEWADVMAKQYPPGAHQLTTERLHEVVSLYHLPYLEAVNFPPHCEECAESYRRHKRELAEWQAGFVK